MADADVPSRVSGEREDGDVSITVCDCEKLNWFGIEFNWLVVCLRLVDAHEKTKVGKYGRILLKSLRKFAILFAN